MANLALKKQNFVNSLMAMNAQLLATCDALNALYAEWNANAYATGASPSGNNIADADLQAGNNAMQCITAAQLDSAIGAQVTVCASIASNRGYLEAIRV